MSGRAVRLLALAATVAALALPAAGCKTTVDEITGSVAEPRAPSTEVEWRGALETYGNRYRANPSDAKAAIAYAKALRATDQRAQAVAVLQQASIRNPHDTAVLGAYGRALADAGQYTEALDALSRAHSPDNPDWRILNAQGAVLDEMGRHAEAQRHYATVLKMVPNEPSVLSNLGLSYALDKKLPQAEATLRQAAALAHAGPKVRQNLALVVGLQGRFAEAEKIAGADLPPDQAAANVNYLRQMLAQRNDWKKMGRHMPVPDAGT
ncbi:MAG TPA: tetratricopeptide repeat protein [Pseudolabrys sp.]|nr:tetratricopeptide repeat protein [Pseudolabrys sp.]